MLSKVQKLPGEICKHCNKLCSKKGTSFQCEVCYSWIHASCEGVSNDTYKLFNKLSASMPNIVYCCNLNQCYARLSQLTSVANNPPIENVDHHNFQTFIDNHNVLENSVSKLGTQNDHEALSQANLALEKHFSDLLSTQSETQKIIKPPEVSTAATASSIADELFERERKKNNIIVYNLPEASEQSSEEQNFADLCKCIVKVDLNIQKIFRIGCKDNTRVRPLHAGMLHFRRFQIDSSI